VYSTPQFPLKAVESLPSATQIQLMTMIQSPRLQDWMSAPTSSILFINCSGRLSTQDSPTAFFCAKLAESIVQVSTKTIALSFLCGEHAEKSDFNYGASRMLRSLIGQLLVKSPDFYVRDYFRDLLNRCRKDSSDLRLLCGILESLILRLPSEYVVLCALDAINIHEENDSECDEIEDVMHVLVNISERATNSGRIFKLIMTCAWNSHVLYKSMPDLEKNVVWISSSPSSRTRLTTALWNNFVASFLVSRRNQS
jgi:hypothetical protein